MNHKDGNDLAEAGSIFFSVVIAAYNVQEHIQACIDSILQADCPQTVILVVLGDSSDQTNKICRWYEKRGLVTCVMQDAKGLSNARNCGIQRASGLYLTFVDADDWVVAEQFAAFVRCLSNAERKKRREVLFDALANDFLFADPAGKILFQNRQIQKLKQVHGMSSQRLILQYAASKGTFWNAWRYVYRTAYLKEENRRFWEGHTCEDLEFAVQTLLDTCHVVLVHMPYYCYCPVRPLSLMHSKDLLMIQDFGLVLRRLFQICIQKKSPLAWAILEKLKELLTYNLPDIWEVEKKQRRAAVQEYQKLLNEIGIAKKGWEKYAGIWCLSGGMLSVSRMLYRAKSVRRKYRYHEKPEGGRQGRKAVKYKRRMDRC